MYAKRYCRVSMHLSLDENMAYHAQSIASTHCRRKLSRCYDTLKNPMLKVQIKCAGQDNLTKAGDVIWRRKLGPRENRPRESPVFNSATLSPDIEPFQTSRGIRNYAPSYSRNLTHSQCFAQHRGASAPPPRGSYKPNAKPPLDQYAARTPGQHHNQDITMREHLGAHISLGHDTSPTPSACA